MKLFATLAFLCLFLTGCDKQAEKSITTSNSAVKAEVLFTDENGFTVHRFYDGGHNRYYVTPSGETMTTNRVQNGKTSYTYPSTIPTVLK